MDSEKLLYSKKEFKSVNNNKKKKLKHSHNETLGLGVGMGSRAPPGNGGGKFGFRKQEHRITIPLTSRSKQEMKEIKRKLVSELDLVRRLVKKIEEVGSKPLNNVSKSGRKKVGGSGTGTVDAKFSSRLFKSCGTLLERLMKHKHGWVFNEPVNAKLLGLHDYHDIIKHPMDLGTVKSRLAQGFYKTPGEFAEDVRLTFHNAMTYNPQGQDVHVMAAILSNIFEERWVVIESDWRYGTIHDAGTPTFTPTPTSKKVNQFRTLDRSQSMGLPFMSRPKPPSFAPVSRVRVPKKPKANDLNKRDMTYEEKQKLSSNLQSLPSEKLDNIVQIIKKSNTSLSQNDDEIEVDIDSVDVETLWELDRFVLNYKKNLSKHRRKAELSQQARALAGTPMLEV